MKIYSSYDINDFIICCGYKGYLIKEYFRNYFLHISDVTFDIQNNEMEIHRKNSEPWKVTLIDTGENTMTGGRLKRVAEFIEDENEFCFTYGDGVSDVNISDLINYHRSHGKLATLTAVKPPGRFGALKIREDGVVEEFQEKTEGERSWINGGFFVLNPKVLELITSDDISWEGYPLSSLASGGDLVSFKHQGFWQPMDTPRVKKHC